MMAGHVIFLSFKYNAAKFTRPPFCNFCFRDSQGGREMFQNVSTPLPSRAFPLCSLTLRGTSQEATSLPLGRVWALEKVKSRSFKDPNPAPSLLPLDRAICNLTPSQTRVSAGLNFSKEGEPYSVHMPLTDHCWGLWQRQESQENENKIDHIF